MMVWPGPAAFVAQVALPTPDEVRLLQPPLIDAYEVRTKAANLKRNLSDRHGVAVSH